MGIHEKRLRVSIAGDLYLLATDKPNCTAQYA